MKIIVNSGCAALLILGTMSIALTGCGPTPPPPAPPAPVAKIGTAEKKFIDVAKDMSPQQQMDFFKKNPQMTQNSAVMAKLREETPKVQIRESHGERPRLPTGRPSL